MIFSLAVLEDNDQHFQEIENMLAQVNPELNIQYKVERFTQVKEAVTKLYGRAPDLLLVDLNLLDSTGFETLEAVKKIKSPLLVMSILEDPTTALKCIQEGTFYLVKDWFFQSPLILHLALLRAYEIAQHRERIKVLIRERLGQFRQLIPRCKFCVPRIGEPRFKDESNNQWFTFTGYAEQIGINFTDGICPECFEDMRKAVEGNGHSDSESP